MEIQAVNQSPNTIEVDALVVGVFSDTQLAGHTAQLDRATGGLIRRLLDSGEITGKPYEVTPLYAPPEVAAPLVLVAGCGKQADFDAGAAFRAASAAARFAAGKPRRRVAFYLDLPGPPKWIEAAVAGVLAGSHGTDLYRAEKNRHPFHTALWSTAYPQILESGRVIGEAVNLARELVNQPPDAMYPESFAARAVAVARGAGLEIEVWDRDRLEAERCGSLLAVARGSSRDPRLVIVRYQGAPTQAAPVAWVGKGVTFDSGGLSLKPTDGMLAMKCDMAGAATALAAIQAVARLKLPVNVIALAGLVENMTGPAAMKLGDVLTARSGRTIEVQNTDAEGRLVLADVLNVALERGADRIVDLATLTGACVVALGTDVAGLMTNDAAWSGEVKEAAAASGELVWELPMYPHYRELIQSEVADIRNVGEGRWAGAITAGKFLEEFVDGKPWVHLDIAGVAFGEKARPWLDVGATGAMVRTLVELARRAAGAA